MIRVHIDFEFTDFNNTDIISVGAAANNGAEFYGENAEFIQPWASDWVKSNIYPLLDLSVHGMKRLELSARLWCWLDELPCTNVIVSADNHIDFKLLTELFNGEMHPKVVVFQNIHDNIFYSCDEQIKAVGGSDQGYEQLTKKVKAKFELYVMDYFIRTKEIQHHALSDAKANREAYTKIVNEFGIIC